MMIELVLGTVYGPMTRVRVTMIKSQSSATLSILDGRLNGRVLQSQSMRVGPLCASGMRRRREPPMIEYGLGR